MLSKNPFLFSKCEMCFYPALLTNNVFTSCSSCSGFYYLCTLNFQFGKICHLMAAETLMSEGQKVQECDATKVKSCILKSGTKSFQF